MNFHNDDSSVNRQEPACGTAMRQQTLDSIEGCRIWANALGELSPIVYATFVRIILDAACSPCVVLVYATSKGLLSRTSSCQPQPLTNRNCSRSTWRGL